jgi:hypothetical protein
MPREKKEKLKLTERDRKAMTYWAANPVEAVKDWFGVTPDDWQGDSLNGFMGSNARFDRAAIKSGHGPGKTAFEAWAGWVFLNVYEDSRVVATAPTLHQLSDILWAEYAKWHARMPEGLRDRWSISGNHIRSRIENKEKLWFATARTSNKSANLQGFHGTHIFIQVDEASGVPQDVFEVIEGALSEAGEEGKVAKLLLAGNPNFTAGELYDAFKRNRDLYERLTVTGDPLLLDRLGVAQGFEHRDNGRVYFSRRIKPKYRQTIESKYGIDSAVYDVRVRGMFPRLDDSAVIPYEWAERASGLVVPHFDQMAHPVTLVLDPAREGGNETVLGSFRGGIPVEPLIGRAKSSAFKDANLVEDRILYWKEQGIQVLEVIVDEPGIGGDTIKELQRRDVAVKPYHGGKLLESGRDPDDEVRTFGNRRARDWWNVRRLLELNRLPLPADEVLVAQLASLQYYYNKQEKIVVESKQDLKDRLGKEASPDRGDVIVMGCAPWHSFNEANTSISDQDVFLGEDRPQLEDYA